MSSLDIYEDGFPHGTVEGYRRGCRSGVCPAREFDPLADSCRQANVRYQGDWEYRRAVEAGLTPPPMIHDKPEKASRSKAGSIISEPTIEVADSFEPLPLLDLRPSAAKVAKVAKTAVEEEPKATRARPGEWKHGTITGYTNHGCRKDNECPAFLAGGQSCRLAARQYWRDRAAQKRLDGMSAADPRIGSLFSGYGGLDLGVQMVHGGEVQWHVEFDAAPSKILAHHWPDVPNYGDVRTVDWASVPPIDILTGGFPCQDVSLAGRRAGLTNGTRSGLWSEYARAIDILRPEMVVIENVRGLLSAEAAGAVEPDPWGVGDGATRPTLNAFGVVLGDLAGLGYDARWVGLRAADAGAPHGRFRVFIVAHPRGERLGADLNDLPGRQLDAAGGVAEDADLAAGGERWESASGQAASGRPRADVGRRGGAPVPDAHCGERDGWERYPLRAEGRGAPTPGDRAGAGATADPCSERLGEHAGEPSAEEARPTGGDVADGAGGLRPDQDWGPYRPAVERWEQTSGRVAPSPTRADGKAGAQRLSPVFVEWMMGLPDGHVTDPAIGLTRNEQLKALGNGVVPQQAALALRLLEHGHDRLVAA